MIIINSPQKIYKTIDQLKQSGKTIGFVPTMGSLHQGHLSLIKIAKKETDIVVVSIYINPMQFSQNEDFDSYPRTIESDSEACKKAKADIVFIPNSEKMLTKTLHTQVYIPKLGQLYCGQSRPHFFQGVCSILLRLFNIVTPNLVILGEKDYQQLIIVRQMIQDLFLPIRILAGPIIREPNGLALSSRNHYLTKEEKKEASKIFKLLEYAKNIINQGEHHTEIILKKLRLFLNQHTTIKEDYLNFSRKDTLEPAKTVQIGDRILFAGYLNKVRLIDNTAL